jgi:hypothetical protein
MCTWKLLVTGARASVRRKAFTPTSSPARFTSGPPESPGEMVQLVWTTRPGTCFSMSAFWSPIEAFALRHASAVVGSSDSDTSHCAAVLICAAWDSDP